ncbi:MAG: ethanolamine ammonia-lyase reactivating factor EutA [Promethearchaeota archaeon]|jgi:ethanolamine utilization protein EutA
MDVKERIANIEINAESQKMALEYYLKFILEKNTHQDSEDLLNEFMREHEKLVKKHENEDTTDLSRFYRHIMAVKPALNTILKPGKEHDEICDIMVLNFNVILDRVRKQVNDKNTKKKTTGPILSGSSKSFELRYYCTVCNESFEIPSDEKVKIDNSDENIDLPKHHEKEMVIKIIKIEEKIENNEELEEIKIYPAELLMGHSDSTEHNTEYLKILSVGIDVGSSTSHLIFSKLTLKRETSFFNMSNRFDLVNREIIYEGNIIFTPLLDRFTIDIEAVIEFCQDEYKKAGMTPDMVNTGAVIVTGETAKKQNAEEIVKRLSSESGKFVSASAGPNFESLLGAMGSGIVEVSREKQNTILNIDIGGGTSNLAISSKGEVVSTSCINIGGRLLGIDEDFKIWRIDEPSEEIMEALNMNYKIGDIIPEEDVKIIAREYAKALFEVMRGPATTTIAQKLMMTTDLDFSIPIDAISFSGGVAEIIYGKNDGNTYNDIGLYLAKEIKKLSREFNVPLIEPENKIRATVIGAGAFSLSVSGSTCYYDESIKLPIRNIPVVPVNIDMKKDDLKERVDIALNNFNMKEGEDTFALYFKDLLNPKALSNFAISIEQALPNSVANDKLIILILRFDGAKMLGITIRNETSIKKNVFCLDELELEAGDWIDIGAPLKDGEAFPVTIKSLVYNKDNNNK